MKKKIQRKFTGVTQNRLKDVTGSPHLCELEMCRSELERAPPLLATTQQDKRATEAALLPFSEHPENLFSDSGYHSHSTLHKQMSLGCRDKDCCIPVRVCVGVPSPLQHQGQASSLKASDTGPWISRLPIETMEHEQGIPCLWKEYRRSS